MDTTTSCPVGHWIIRPDRLDDLDWQTPCRQPPAIAILVEDVPAWFCEDHAHAVITVLDAFADHGVTQRED